MLGPRRAARGSEHLAARGAFRARVRDLAVLRTDVDAPTRAGARNDRSGGDGAPLGDLLDLDEHVGAVAVDGGDRSTALALIGLAARTGHPAWADGDDHGVAADVGHRGLPVEALVAGV